MSVSKGKMKIGNRFILSGILVLMTLLATMMVTTVTSFAAESNVDGGTSKDLQELINKAENGDRIFISDTITVDKTVEVNKNITLTGSGTLIHEDGFKGAMVYVGSNSELIMEDITIDGNGTKSDNSAVYIYKGKFQMKSGTIKNNQNGGVYNKCGTFEMTGGTILGNNALHGGGVYNYRGTFEMTNGLISGNRSSFGGGVYNMSYSNFKMTGGTISGNESINGGGVCNCGTFKMDGGIISKNYASEYGGGVFNWNYGDDYIYIARFEMNAGTITGNKAYRDGGGYYKRSGIVRINEEKAVIEGNAPEDGYLD